MAALQASDKCSHTHVCCALSIGLRLALEPDLRLFETTSCWIRSIGQISFQMIINQSNKFNQ
jgi:hypothetical protein